MNNVFSVAKQGLKNKILLYVFSRYVVYALQFGFSLLVAIKLGPFYLGVWGVILLILNYFALINFGITNSINILLIQNKDNEEKSDNIIKTSIVLTIGLCLLIVLFTIYYEIFGISYFDKYSLNNHVIALGLIGIFAYFNNLLSTIFRVKNDIAKVAFFQSILPVVSFIALFLAKDVHLISFLLGAYLIGHFASLLNYVFSKKVNYKGKYNNNLAIQIIKKGFPLFIYNTSFYFIIASTRSMISYFYKVEEFGYFSFTYNLSNSVLLLLDAFSFIIFPKMIDMLGSKNWDEVEKNLSFLRRNYITLSNFLIYVLVAVFPVFISFLPKYKDTFMLFQFICLTLLALTNCYGNNAFLMAQNKERLLAILAFSTLVVNLILCFVIIKVFRFTYEYVVLATFLAYLLYSLSIYYFSNKLLGKKDTILQAMIRFMPLRLFIPLVFSVISAFTRFNFGSVICLLLFLILNFKESKEIMKSIKRILNKPNIVNI